MQIDQNRDNHLEIKGINPNHLREQFHKWTDELVDLTGRNLLISFKVTKRSTVEIPYEHPVLQKLYQGEDCQINQLLDLKKPENLYCAKEIIKIAIENDAQLGIQTLYLVQGLLSWKNENPKGNAKIKTPLNAPILIFPLKFKNIKSYQRYQIQLDPSDMQINPFLLYHLKQFGIDPTTEEIDQLLEGGYVKICDWLSKELSPIGEIEIAHQCYIRNLSYHKLPMVNDLKNAFDPMSKHGVISALAGDSRSRSALKSKSKTVDIDLPNEMLTRDEFLILDADASQNLVINAAIAGNDLVIEGPPGTGKSQTIANLIACFIARGKKVLFVAEKRAAIDAVARRLKACQLDDFICDLHDISDARKLIPQQMSMRISQVEEYKSDQFALNTPLDEIKKSLDRQSKAIHQKSNCGLSYYELITELFAIPQQEEFEGIDLPLELIDQIKLEDFDQIKLSIKYLMQYESWRLKEHFPFEKAIHRLKNPELAFNLVQRLDTLKSSLISLKTWLDQFHGFLGKEGLKEKEFQRLETLEDIFEFHQQLDLLEPFALDFNQSFFSLNHAQLQQLKDHLNPLFSPSVILIFHKLFNSEFKNALLRMANYINPDHVKTQEITPALIEKIDDFIEIKKQIERILCCKNPSSISFFYQDLVRGARNEDTLGIFHFEMRDQKIKQLMVKIKEHLHLLNGDLNQLISPKRKIEDIIAQIDVLMPWRDFVTRVPKILEELNRLSSFQLSTPFLQILKKSPQRNLQLGKKIYEFIRFKWLKRYEEELKIKNIDLINISSEQRDLQRDEFKKLDELHIQQKPKIISQIINQNAKKELIQQNAQKELILMQAARKRGHMPIRQLAQKTSQLLLALKPCWLMSPLAVSQVLPTEKYFDLVIFDEASQIVPADAISALVRAEQVIVAGDSKQLSPTDSSFFAKKDQVEDFGLKDDDQDNEWDENQMLETESLLQAIKNILPSDRCIKTLRWHYRSEDERLIAFSNQHPHLYQSQLITIPSVFEQSPFHYHLVNEAKIEDLCGKSPNAEVRYAAQLAIETLKNHPQLSLALIAFGADHARRIEDEFYEQLKHYPQLSLHPNHLPDETFVVRHLESIQGDERDLIILSTGYGRNAKTKDWSYHYGALNRSENDFGLRRLNVAITRARKAMMVVTTIDVDQLDPSRIKSIGARAFIDFLKFSRSGGHELGILSFAKEGDSQVDQHPLNAFELDIYHALSSKGLKLVPQYGISGYRLDFAVLDPRTEGKYLMAIEADGATYHAIPTVRDRDRIRQQQLEKLGWKFHRIWSTSWFNHREEEIEKAVNAYENILKQTSVP